MTNRRKQVVTPLSAFYGGRSLDTRYHGETFFTVLELKCQRDGLFLLDEPEAALSPQRQLALLVLVHDVLRKRRDAQFIISSHSPILLGYPDAQIVSFDDGLLQDVQYEDTAPMQIVRRFLIDRDHFLDELFGDSPTLFDRMQPRWNHATAAPPESPHLTLRAGRQRTRSPLPVEGEKCP